LKHVIEKHYQSFHNNRTLTFLPSHVLIQPTLTTDNRLLIYGCHDRIDSFFNKIEQFLILTDEIVLSPLDSFSTFSSSISNSTHFSTG